MNASDAEKLLPGHLVRTVKTTKKLIPQSDIHGNLVLLAKPEHGDGQTAYVLSDGQAYNNKQLRPALLPGGKPQNRPFLKLMSVLQENKDEKPDFTYAECEALSRIMYWQMARQTALSGEPVTKKKWAETYGIAENDWFKGNHYCFACRAAILGVRGCSACPFLWGPEKKYPTAPCTHPGSPVYAMEGEKDPAAFAKFCRQAAMLPSSRYGN